MDRRAARRRHRSLSYRATGQPIRSLLPIATSSSHILTGVLDSSAMYSPTRMVLNCGAVQLLGPEQPSPDPFTRRESWPSMKNCISFLVPSKLHSQHIQVLSGKVLGGLGLAQQSLALL